MDRRRDYSFSLLMTLIAVALLVPPFAFGAFAFVNLVAKDQAAQRERLQQTALALTRTVDADLAALKQLARVLAGSRSLSEGDIAGFEVIARDTAIIGRHAVVLTDPQGRQLVNTRLQLGETPPQSRNGDVLKDVFASGQPIVSNLLKATLDSRPTVAVSAPVQVAGKFAYALSIMPELSLFAGLVATMPLPESWVAAIDDRNGKIVARSHESERFIGAQSRLRTEHGGSGIVPFVDLEGRPSIMAYAVSAKTGYRGVVWAPEAAFYSPANTLLRTYGAVAALTLLLTGLAALVARRALRRPLSKLVVAALALAQGKEVTASHTALREINIVGSTLEDASRTIRAREHALRQETEKTRELVKELSHRTKNMMAVIIAIARQSARVTKDDRKDTRNFIATFEARLASLAASNELVLNATWERVALKSLITNQLMPFGFEHRVRVEGPDMLLLPSAVQPLGMALHELATNAVKYGALSNDRGTVLVTWRVSDAAFDMRWAERNGPRVNEPERRGFGTTVVEGVCAAGLSGSAKLEFMTDGLVWMLTAPIEAVAANPALTGARAAAASA